MESSKLTAALALLAAFFAVSVQAVSQNTAVVSPALAASEHGPASQRPPCLAASMKTSEAYRFDAGTFSSTIVQASSSSQGNYEIVRLNILFENTSDHNIVLAYHARTSILADEQGNTYFGAKPGNGPDISVTGMGTDGESKTDPQFVLRPHQCDSATFQLWGPKMAKQEKPRAPLFRYDVTLDELDSDNPRRVIRQHALYFGDFTTTPRTPISIETPAELQKSTNGR
jgi:hypothetical protein